MKKIITIAWGTFLAAVPFVSAQAPKDCTAEGICELPNPLPYSEPVQLLGFLSSILLGFTGSLSLLFVILGGYRLLISRGNAEEIKKGQQTIVWAVIGVVLSLLSYVILTLVIRTVTGGSGQGT